MKLKIVYGYEVPASISDEACGVLGKLDKNGVVLYLNDDGPGLSVRSELLDIAGLIGLETYSGNNHYRLVLLDDDGVERYKVEATS